MQVVNLQIESRYYHAFEEMLSRLPKESYKVDESYFVDDSEMEKREKIVAKLIDKLESGTLPTMDFFKSLQEKRERLQK